MQTIWLSPTGFVTGEPTLQISYPFVNHANVVITSSTEGDLKWISMGLPLPPGVRIEKITICYQVSNSQSFISQVRLTEMDKPDQAIVRFDDPTDLKSTSPARHSSNVGAFVPAAAVTLSLRLIFKDQADRILLGAVGVTIQSVAGMSASENAPQIENLPQDECETRAPVHWEWNGYNWLLTMFAPNPEDPGLFDRFLQSLKENSPEVMAGTGFTGMTPFDSGVRGAIQGVNDPLLGGWTAPESVDPLLGYGRLPADLLAQRIGMLEQYTGALHSQGGVKKLMPYVDFGAQLLGRHNRPPDVPESAWGFWEFYDHWEEYAEPGGPFGLGPKPPDPIAWLAKWHDPNGLQFPGPDPPAIPDDLRGLRFAYYPVKPGYGPAYRYAVCVNTLGWALWWKQVVQWVARVGYGGAFVDNSFLTPCWNQECQEGYRKWLEENFTAQEIRRYFTTATNNLLIDPSIEGPWCQETPGQWRTPYWGSYPSQTSPFFPDNDAYGGRYSCRIEGSGSDVVYLSHVVQGKNLPPFVPANEDLRLTFYYKTTGLVQAKAIIAIAGAPELERVLALEDSWTQEKIDFHTPPDSSGNVDVYLRFEVMGMGKVWLDEFWLGKASQPPELTVELWKPSDDVVLKWAAEEYWSQVTDEKLAYLRDQARQVNPDFSLFTNGFHAANADYFMSEGMAIDLDSYRYDVGFYPGVYMPQDPPIDIRGRKVAPMLLTQPLIVTNIFDYKYVHSRRVPGFFGYHMPTWAYADNSYAHNPDSALLNMAEAAAFGGGAGPENGFRYGYFLYGADPALLAPAAAGIREVEKHFWEFVERHKNRYSGYRTHADVGIVYHDLPDRGPAYTEFHQALDLAKGLAGRGVLWDVLTENRCNSVNFARLRALVYQDVSRISEDEAQAVLEFIGNGGLVIAAGVVGDDDEWFRMRLPDPTNPWPPVGLPPTDNVGTRARGPAFQQQAGVGALIYQPTALSADQVIAATEAHLSRTVQMAENLNSELLDRLRFNAWIRPEGGGTITLHIVNYNVPLGVNVADQAQPLSNLQVSVPVPPQMQIQSVWLHSPESNGPPQVVPFNVVNGLVTFEIPSLRIYTMAVIE